MSPRDFREIRIRFDESGDLSVASGDPEEGGEVVHGAGPSARGTSPEEIPLDRSPGREPPPLSSIFELWCRGPCQLWPVRHTYGGGPGLGFHFRCRHHDTDAGPEGAKLGPGACAFSNRPLSSDEPTEILIYGTPYDEFVNPIKGQAPFDTLQLAGNIHQLARVELELSHLSNLITRSDYVIGLTVHREDFRFVTEIQKWGSDQGGTRYIPLAE